MRKKTWPKLIMERSHAFKLYRYKRKKAGATYTEYKLEDLTGDRRKFHTCSTEEGAEAKAEEIVDALNRGETEALTLNNKQVADCKEALEIIAFTGLPLRIVALHFAESFKVLGGDRVLEASKDYAKRCPISRPTKTPRQVLDEMLAVKTKTKAPDSKAEPDPNKPQRRGISERYAEDLEYRCGKFAEAFSVPIASIGSDDVRKWLTDLDLSDRSHDNFFRSVRTLFEFAKNRKYIPKDYDTLDGIELLDDNEGETEIYSVSEATRLIAAACDDLKPVLAIAAFAGLRSAELERLDWSEVHFRDSVIEVRGLKAKTGSRRIVPISKNLAAWLAPFEKKSGAVWPHSHPFFYEAQRDAAKRTGDAKKEIKPVEWKRNAFRHSYGSYRLAILQDPAKVAYEMGNSPVMVSKHYRQIRLPDGTLITPAEGEKWFALMPPPQERNVIQFRAVAAAAQARV